MEGSQELRESARRAFERFTTPPRCAASARELAVMASAEHFDLELAGSERVARAYAWGEGPPIALVHGWGGRAAQLAAFVEPLVERGMRVFAADAPAHGESEGERSNVLEFVALVRGLEARGGALHGAVGHSLGAAAIAMALASGTALERAALVAPTARLHDEFAKFARGAALPPDLQAAVEEHARETLVRDLWERTRLASIAPRIAVDTLVVHDEHDPDVPFAAAAALAAALPRGTLHATQGLGHFALLRTRAVIERVVSHIDDAR